MFDRLAWAVLLTTMLLGSVCAGEPDLAAHFARYTKYEPAVPVYVMPGERLLHRFFDTSPISPSGRWLAVLRLPFEDRAPRPGDAAEVVLVDLCSGQSRTVATTRGWEMQVGANLQWGPTDAELYFNDVDPQTWKAFAVRFDPQTGQRRQLDGTVCMVSPDGKTLATHNSVKSRLAQVGYGVVIPDDRVPKNIGPVDDDGIYLTDTASGRSRMIVSLRTIYERSEPSIRIANPQDYEYYAFVVKWNPQGTRLLATVQWTPRTGGKRRRTVITMRPDGSDLCTAITADEWAKGGHHVNWCPDGEHLTMNLSLDGTPKLSIIRVRYDGSELESIFAPGSGHPSFHPAGRYMIADSYPYEPVAFGDGSVPIRLIDIPAGTCRNIVRMFVSPTKGELRIDAHPAWDPSGRFVVFNGFADGTRKVYVADLRGL